MIIIVVIIIIDIIIIIVIIIVTISLIIIIIIIMVTVIIINIFVFVIVLSLLLLLFFIYFIDQFHFVIFKPYYTTIVSHNYHACYRWFVSVAAYSRFNFSIDLDVMWKYYYALQYSVIYVLSSDDVASHQLIKSWYSNISLGL